MVKALLLAVVLLSTLGSAGCRKSKPPEIDICLHDGFGGGDCLLRQGSRLRATCSVDPEGRFYCPPSALENMWMTTPEDMEAYSAWAYDTSRKNVKSHMRGVKQYLTR